MNTRRRKVFELLSDATVHQIQNGDGDQSSSSSSSSSSLQTIQSSLNSLEDHHLESLITDIESELKRRRITPSPSDTSKDSPKDILSPSKNLVDTKLTSFFIQSAAAKEKKARADASSVVSTHEDLLSLLTFEPLEKRADYLKKFEDIAEKILLTGLLYAGGVAYRINEIEFYYNGDVHIDAFAHCDPDQRTAGTWYFHKQGSNYKSGTYKGLDIAFGSPTFKESTYGGILIRTIERVSDSKIFEGPCVSVNQILADCKVDSIINLVAKKTFNRKVGVSQTESEERCDLYLTIGNPKIDKQIFKSARVGLSMKTKSSTHKPELFVAHPYRFQVESLKKVRKGRPYLIASLYGQGKSESEISSLMGSGGVKECIKLFEEGKDMTGDDFYLKALEGNDMCKLVGYCWKHIEEDMKI